MKDGETAFGTDIVASVDAADRVAYARDLWPRHHMAVRAGNVAAHRPSTIVWPTSTQEVARIVRGANERGIPLVPFGAGSGVCGGVLPDPHTVVVDLKRMSRWRHFDPDAGVLEVEAGHMGLPLEEDLERRGFTLGHFPSSILCSTVGGWVAARSAGQCSGRYGKIEDMILALECVTGKGDVVTLRHRATGPNLIPLVVGSEGTLAIVTSATLRLHRRPKARVFSSFSFPTTERGWETMREIFQAGLRPAVSRLYDPFDAMLARRGAVKTEKREKERSVDAPGLGIAALRRALRKPGIVNELLESRIGSKVLGGSLLVLIFEGEEDEAQRASEAARALALRRGAKDEGEAPARRWLAHRYSISYRQAPMFAAGLFLDTMEVAAPWSKLHALYNGVRNALGEHVFVMAHLSHAYPDGCCVYFTFVGTAGSGEGGWDARCEAVYDRVWRAALEAAVAAGGTLSHHHGVGRSKSPRLSSEVGNTGNAVVGALMKAFDPKGVLNPGCLRPEARPASDDAYPTEVPA